MATVDIDLTNQGVGIVDQSDYGGDTILNVLSDGYSVLDVHNQSGPTGDVLEVQYTFVTQDVDHDFLHLYENSHVKLLPAINQAENFTHTFQVDDNATLEMSNAFLSTAPAGQHYAIRGAGDTIIDATGLDASSLNIQYTPSEYGHLTFTGADYVEYDQFIGNSLVFKDYQGNIVGEASIGGQTYDPDMPSYIDPNKFQIDGGTVYYACYLKGTHIATPEGETKVEDLKAGDVVLTASGGTARVKWLGYRTLNKNRIPSKDAKRAYPILFKKGCIANNVPHRDLIMSPGHHVSFDGNLVSAMNLVNGTSIVQLFDMPSFQYFHVELEQFDILLAEGVPAESYVDTGNRNMFQNAREVALNPDFGPATGRPDIPGITVVRKGPILEAIRAKLLERRNWMQAPEIQKQVG